MSYNDDDLYSGYCISFLMIFKIKAHSSWLGHQKDSNQIVRINSQLMAFFKTIMEN